MTAVSLESLGVCTFSSEGPLELHTHTLYFTDAVLEGDLCIVKALQ